MRRREFLTLAAASCCWAENAPWRSEVLPSESKRYSDPTTEFPVTRLTAPTFNSYLTAPQNRAIGRNFMLFSSDREGKLDVYRLDLRSGQQRRLTQAQALDPASLALLPDDRGFCYVDGPSLRWMNLGTFKEHEVYRAEPPYERLGDISLGHGSGTAYFTERKPGGDQLRSIPLLKGPAVDIVESEDEISLPVPKPGGGVAYRSKGLLYFRSQREAARALRLAPGRIGPVYWSPDGSALLYLNIPEAPSERNSLREYVLSTGQDRLIARTSQFVEFAPNADASVFVGASGSQAAPHILILIRSVRRELTMCEHRAKDLRNLAVAFSPNSQRVIFQSDQHGKSALYSVAVERFVAETES
jgi:hypothetical protein